MGISNRREFLRSIAVGGASVTAGLAAAGLLPRRYFAEASSDFTRVAFRMLGSTGFKVSEIGFGAMNMRDPELIHAALDKGINYFDTAHAYMRGINEEIIGQAVKAKRDKVFLTTKVTHRNPKELQGMMATSLKRLQTDYADLMLLHAVNSRDETLNADYIKEFEEAKKKGICRFIGVSTHRNHAEVLDAVVDSKIWDAVLVGYNYTSPPNVKQAIEKARKAGIAIIAMKNLLNVQYRPWKFIPIEEDIRKDKNANITPSQALIKWVLQDPYVDTTIPGMTSFEHLNDDVAVMGMKMSFDDRQTIYKYSESIRDNYCRGVAGCTGCLDQCPKGVKICDLNRCLAYAYGYGNLDLAWENYRQLPRSSRIDVCSDCTECEVKCVNGLNLTETVQRAKELFA